MTARDGFRWVHLVFLAVAVVMLPWSTAFLSIAQMVLSANWLAEGIVRRDLPGRFRRAFGPGPVLVFISFFWLHVLGLLWTTDMEWGIDLCRILLPVLVFGVVVGERPPLKAGELRIVLLLGAWSVVTSALFCLLFPDADAGDYRGAAQFISHIRMALLLALAVVVFLHFLSGPAWLRAAHLAATAFALWYIARLGSLQAFALLAVVGATCLWRHAARWGAGPRRTVRTVLLVAPVLLLFAGWRVVHESLRPPDPALFAAHVHTAGGEAYHHEPTDLQTENGHPTWSFIAADEVRRTWRLRSARPLDGRDALGHPLFATLTRYLTSRGLYKDSVGVMALTDEDVRRIEAGVTNVHQGRRSTLLDRMDEVLFELQIYRSQGDANGHSVTMRLEYLKAGWAIARANLLTGVGTGDTRPAFAAQYEAMHSSLLPAWRNRAHNEYLTLLISFGILGFAWALVSVGWPAWKLGAWRRPLFVAWLVLFAGACLTDDTVETQAGATFFALYYALFVFAAREMEVS